MRFLLKCLTVSAALMLSGCVSVVAPLKTVGEADARLTKQASLAFMAEPDLRREKQLFYERARGYLVRAGYHFVPESEADYLIRLTTSTHIFRAVTVTPGTDYVPGHVFGEKVPVTYLYFSVFKREDLAKEVLVSTWEASINGRDEDFRASEEQLVLGVFAHLGENFKGEVVLPKRG